MEESAAILLNRGRYANADVWRVETADGPVVRKDFSPRSWLVRQTIGRFLVWREVHFLTRLAGCTGVPGRIRRIHPFCCEEQFYESRVLRGHKPPPPITYFHALEAVVKEIHRRGIAHLDLHNGRNMLVTPDALPVILDWQSAVSTHGVFRPLKWIAERVDLAGVYKHWERAHPGTLSDEQQKVMNWLRKYRRLWIPRGYFFSRKPQE